MTAAEALDTRRIQEYIDKQAVRDALMRYTRGVDRRDEALVRGAYHPDAYDDHGYYKGDVDGFIQSLHDQVWPPFICTMHFVGNQLVEVDGDVAYSEAYCEAHHVRRGDDGRVSDRVYGLRYVDRFERRDGEWRIAHRVCTWDWQRLDDMGEPVWPENWTMARRDREDPVYARW